MNISSVAQYTEEDLEEVFEPHLAIFYPRPRVYGGCGYPTSTIEFCYPSRRIIFRKKGWEQLSWLGMGCP
jgi:hypothetical protein